MRTAACPVIVFACALLAGGDSVVLLSGSEYFGKVLSQDDKEVVLNTFNSTMKEMTWGVKRFERSAVDRVVIDPPDPLREYWFRKCDAKASHADLMSWCVDHGLGPEARAEALEVLIEDPDSPQARAVLEGEADALMKRSPRHNEELRAAIANWAALDAAGRKAAYERLKSDFGVTLPRAYFDRVARSAAYRRGVVEEDRRLTYNTQKASGVYTVWTPKTYDPHRSYPLILALHGTWNGFGGIGNGRDFIKHFTYAETGKWDVVIVSPTADPRPWTAKGDDFVLTVIAEAMLLYNIDMNRVYVIGHSMGGRGTYHFGIKYAAQFAAFAPAASGPGGLDLLAAATQGTGIYIYHSSDDSVASCEGDRKGARQLQEAKADYVYTEWTDQDHGWPQAAIADTFLYFKRHQRMERGAEKPVPCRGVRASFAEPLWPDEEKYFRIPRAANGKSEIADLVAEVELGGLLAWNASTRLLELKDKAAVAPLAALLAKPGACDDAREQAARALAAVKDASASAALIKALTDKELRVRVAAARSLVPVASQKDAIPIATALLALGQEFDKAYPKKWMGDEAWRDWHDLNASIVEALAATGEGKTWSAVADVSIQKILLTDVKSGSAHIDPKPVHRASAIRILKAFPAFREPKLKTIIGLVRERFQDVPEVLEAADEAEKKL